MNHAPVFVTVAKKFWGFFIVMRYGLMVAALLISTNAFAGAWTQDPGKSQLIITNSYYTTDEKFDNNGFLIRQPRYSKHEINPYFEYGLYEGITVGANLSFQRASQSDQTNWGIGDSEFFLRARVFKRGGFVISVEPMVKLPRLASTDDSPMLGGSYPDVGLGLLGGYGFSLFGQHHFTALDLQQRHRFGSPQNQFRLTESLGIGLSENWMVLGQAFATLRQDKPDVAAFTQSSNDDYGLFKLQLSVIYKMNDTTSLQFGTFDNVIGSNVGAGSGLIFAAWKTF